MPDTDSTAVTHTVKLVGAEGLTPVENQYDSPTDGDLSVQQQAASSLASMHGNETVTITIENAAHPDHADRAPDQTRATEAEPDTTADTSAPTESQAPSSDSAATSSSATSPTSW